MDSYSITSVLLLNQTSTKPQPDLTNLVLDGSQMHSLNGYIQDIIGFVTQQNR